VIAAATVLVAALPAHAQAPTDPTATDPSLVTTTTTTDATPPPAPAPDPAPPVTEPTTTDVAPPPVAPAPSTSTEPVAPPVALPIPTVTTEAPAPPPLHHNTPSAHHPSSSASGHNGSKAKKHKASHHKKTATTTATPPPFTRPATVISSLLLDSFRIPPFLLPIYQAAGVQYGIHWQVLAAINEIESDYGRNLNVSSAGALGWMQFMPATWAKYGLDANGDGKRDPYNPVDAIFSAARYLKAAGGDTYIRQSIFAYNHAGWYVNSVLLRARLISALPDSLVSSLTGLTQGRPPVPAPYKVQLLKPNVGVNVEAPAGTAAIAVQDGRVSRIGFSRRLGHFVQLVDVYGNTYTYGHLGTIAQFYPVPKPQKVSAAHVARELHLTNSSGLPVLHDVHHSAHTPPALDLGASRSVTQTPPVMLPGDVGADAATSTTPPTQLAGDQTVDPAADTTATTPADPTATTPTDTTTVPSVPLPDDPAPAPASATPDAPLMATTPDTPTTPVDPTAPPVVATTDTTPAPAPVPDTPATRLASKTTTSQPPMPLAGDNGDLVSALPPIPLKDSPANPAVYSLPGDGSIAQPILLGFAERDRKAGAKLLDLPQSQVSFEPLKQGVSVVGGTVLGRLGGRSLRFEVRPAGAGEPRIDPAPLINGWRQLQHTAIFNPSAVAARAATGLGDDSTTVGQVLLMTKHELMERVLADSRITIYACGRRDIETGQIDRRVLAVLEYLADSNLFPTVSALKCGHSLLTTSGNVSEHSTGDAVDIAAINGTPIYQNQGPGTITDITIRRLLELQGVMKPHQIISLMTFPGADNTLALPDHYDHIHIGYHPSPGTPLPTADANGNVQVGDPTPDQLTPSQWQRLMKRLAQIGNPHVPTTASKYALSD